MELLPVANSAGPAVLVAVITAIGGILIALVKIIGKIFGKKPGKKPKIIQLVLFVKDRASEKPLRALVTLERLTGSEERSTDSSGTVKFDVAPDVERSLRARVSAEGHHDRSLEIGALANDKSYTLLLDPS
jgi:hypothetical protein